MKLFRNYLRSLILACFALGAATSCLAQDAPPTSNTSSNAGSNNANTDANQWLAQLSPYTKHYHPSPDHKPVYLVGIERYNANSAFLGGDNSLWGLSYFSNSFGQPSGYAYYGGVFNNVFYSPNWYFKWTGGVLYGYKPPYENKVPYNHNGWSPGLVFGLGYKLTPQFSAQLNALGNAGAMITFSYRFK